MVCLWFNMIWNLSFVSSSVEASTSSCVILWWTSSTLNHHCKAFNFQVSIHITGAFTTLSNSVQSAPWKSDSGLHLSSLFTDWRKRKALCIVVFFTFFPRNEAVMLHWCHRELTIITSFSLGNDNYYIQHLSGNCVGKSKMANIK